MGRVRTHVGDSHLKRRIPSRGTQIPPQLAGVLHHPGIDKDLDVALVVNMVLILGVLSFLQATLTLPGIAGIVLTIGMAVDANVLVFERIREEMKTARGPARAIELGYERAMSAIVDANITTLIIAAILFVLGSGPVKGFAVTLSIGIVTSVFTALYVTRLMTVAWFERARPRQIEV